ncbi:CASR protein, partial [Polypterus senegalus]|nr:CASR protein [Polypterus senegalus]
MSCEEIKCAIQEKFALNGLFKRGDIMLGGTFIKNFKTIPPDLSFTSKPKPWKCESFELSVFQRAQTMIFAVEEINRDESFLPNISLGYRLYDNCNSLPMGLRATVSLISSLSDTFTENNCNDVPPVLAIVGDPISSHSIASSRILSLFRVPMVSYFSTCSCLSNRKEFPTFFRTIPNDDFQVKAMVEIIKYYKWTWIGAVGTDDDYGQNALKALHEQVKMFGCISFSETIPRFNDKSKVEQIITIIKQSSAKVIVAFASEAELLTLVKEIVRQNITGRQWIASESWSTSSLLATKENFRSFGGTIGIAIRRVQIPGLENFFFQVQPKFDPNNNLLIQFWETLFECRFPENVTQSNSSLVLSKVCTGLEDIKSTKSGYTDTSDMRAVYNVYKAVYAIAHALHDLMSCKEGNGPFTNRRCADIKNLQPWQLLHYLKKVNFTNKLGEKITFDENGDPPAVYDIVNWQLDADGSVMIKNIGLFDESAGVGKELDLNKESIFWNPAFGSVGNISFNSCLPGTRKATRKGEPVCCFDCISCAEGEISSETGSIAIDDDYGQYAIKTFNEEVKKFGCISFSETIPKVNEKLKVIQIVKTIKQSTAKVIVVFSSESGLPSLIKEIVNQNVTGRQWIASETWSTSAVFAVKENFHSFGGTIGIAIRSGEIPGLKPFLLQVHPNSDPNNNLLNLFWEKMFGCKLQENINQTNETSALYIKQCTGQENLKDTQTAYSEIANFRAAYNIYKAVYAIAHSLHDLISCKNGQGPFKNNSCADIQNVQPWQLLHYLKRVNFTNHLGERVWFNENGEPPALYDIVNWQPADDGSVKVKSIGFFDESAGPGKELTLNTEDIYWNSGTAEIPESECSKSCQPGTRKATKKGQPICCFDCIPCAEGEISNQTDAIECIRCLAEFWSNQEKNQCVLKEIEFLSYDDAMGITLTATASFGACLSLGVLSVFLHYRNTPVVKANNSELSFLLLVSLTLCFLCALCFIGEPSYVTCMLRHVVFGVSFALCISCILVKTIVVIIAFKATLPGNNLMKWFGVAQQRGTVFILAFIQALICLMWLTTAPPFPAKNIKYQNSKVIFECDLGSVTGFSCLLGYIGLLAAICFLIAFLARNLPDNFNEAKFITFSMLVFCAVWITFIPAYISSPGKHTVAVEIFAILASSFGVLIAIFAPKCYIILIKPELNTKKALMNRGAPDK